MCVLGVCKSNVVICEVFLQEASNITTKIPINPKLGVWICQFGTYKSNVVVVSVLIDIFKKFERIHKTQELFDNMHDVNIV